MPVKLVCITLLALAKGLVSGNFFGANFYSCGISGVSRIRWIRDFFRSAIDEIGNSDHQAVQAGCGA